MSNDLKNFEEVRLKGEDSYKEIKDVYCPYFKENISFNIQGLNHLKFKDWRKARPQQDQYMRLMLIHLAPKVLKSSSTLQGFLETTNFERIRINNRTEKVLKKINYYEFVAVLEGVRVKIIVKQIDNGNKFFWSIIPYWGVNKETKKKRLYSGYPEND